MDVTGDHGLTDGLVAATNAAKQNHNRYHLSNATRNGYVMFLKMVCQ